jgi:hypothetical protein
MFGPGVARIGDQDTLRPTFQQKLSEVQGNILNSAGICLCRLEALAALLNPHPPDDPAVVPLQQVEHTVADQSSLSAPVSVIATGETQNLRALDLRKDVA